MKFEWLDNWFYSLPITTPIQEPDWKRIAESLYRDLDAIELMSDSTMPSYPGLDRLEQIHYTARSATERFMLTTTETK